MHQHVGRLDADADDTGQQTDHGMGSCLRRFFQPVEASDLDRLDLVPDESKSRQVAPQLGQGVRWERDALWRTQLSETLCRVAQLRFEATDSEAHQATLDPVFDAGLLA